MRNNNLDEIVKCDIEISNPVMGEDAFSTILVVVPPPAAAGATAADVMVITDPSELLEKGFVTTETAYKAATVAFMQSPEPDRLVIALRKTPSGESNPEAIGTTLARAADAEAFYGVHLSEYNDATTAAAAATWCETNEKMLFIEFTGSTNPLANASNFRSVVLYTGSPDGETSTVNQFGALAWAAKCFMFEPGSETWHIKEIDGIAPSLLTTDQKTAYKTANVNTVLRYAGRNVTIGGYTTAGEWIDVVRFRDWLKMEIQTNVFDVLRLNDKVPYTDKGISLIGNALNTTLQTAQNNGGIAPDEFDDDGVKYPGYAIALPSAMSMTEMQRKSRVLGGIRWSARLAGAIHLVEISGVLNY